MVRCIDMTLVQTCADLENFTAEELINLHRGQGMDLYWRDSLTCPTEQEYIDMVSNSEHAPVFCPAHAHSSCCFTETGGLFRIAIRLMEATSTEPDKGYEVLVLNVRQLLTCHAHSAYVPLVNLIGVLFQIADDYLNLRSDTVCRVCATPRCLS